MNKWIIIIGISILLSMETAAVTNTGHDMYEISTEITTAKDSTLRGVYIESVWGLAAVSLVGVGYQLDDDWAFGLKYFASWQSDWQTARGIGVRISRRTHINYINNVNLEFTPFFESTFAKHDHISTLFKGYGLVLTVGNEKIKSPGIYFTWQFGAMASFALHHRTLIVPAINIGLNINLF
jgi:hypothetical protein